MTSGGPVLEVDAPIRNGSRLASGVAMGAQRAGIAGSFSLLAVYYGMRFLATWDLAPPEGSEEIVHLRFLIGALSTGLVMGFGKWLRDRGWETVF